MPQKTTTLGIVAAGALCGILLATYGLSNKPPSSANNAAEQKTSSKNSAPVESPDKNEDTTCARFATPKKTILALLAKNTVKDEFETSAVFAARMRKEFVGNISAAKHLYEISSIYDADLQTLTIDVQGGFSIVFADSPNNKEYQGFEISKLETSGGEYVGSNAFGVKKQIQITNRDTTYVVFSQIGVFDQEKLPRPSLKVDPQTARALKKSICLVVKGVPVEPYKIDTTSNRKPTIDLPYESNNHELSLVLKADSGEVVDAATGKVLAQFNPSRVWAYFRTSR